MMEEKKVTRIKVEVDMSRIIQHVNDNFSKLSHELAKIIADMVDQMQVAPEHRTRVCDVILAQAVLIYADGAASVAEAAKETLANVIEVSGSMH